MEKNLISWNIPNAVSIVLMATIGFFVFGIISQMVLKSIGGTPVDE